MFGNRVVRVTFWGLCAAALTGAIAYGVSSASDPSLLATSEMASMRATCDTCYELTGDENHDQCRIYGKVECYAGASCPDSYIRYWNNWATTCSTQGEENDKKCSENDIICSNMYETESNGTGEDQACEPGYPENWEEIKHLYDWVFKKCKTSSGNTCTKCKWGDIIPDTPNYTDNDSCVPI